MSLFKDANITRRLVLSFTLLCTILMLFGVYSLYETRILIGLTRTIYNHPLVVSNAALQSNVSITKIHRNMKDVVLFENPKRIQDAIHLVNFEEKQVYHHLDIVRKNILGTKGKELEQRAREQFRSWKTIRDEVILLVRSGERAKAAEITIGRGAAHVEKLEAEMLGLTNYARAKASSFMSVSEEKRSRLYISSLIFLASGLFISILVAYTTIRFTASAEKELSESRQLLVNAIDYAPIGMALLDPQGKFYKVNQAYCEITGYSETELLKKSFQEITHPEDRQAGPEIARQLLEKKIDKAQFETRYSHRDGGVVHVVINSSLLRDEQNVPQYFFAQVIDITKRKLTDQKLKASLIEKETLLKEIHHRVKNNMQMIQSIISLQAEQITDDTSKEPLLESIHRIRIMSLIHENLYRSEKLSDIDLQNYFAEFTMQIQQAFKLHESGIELIADIEPLHLPIDSVIVSGLIVNELVTNAIKYAFPNHDKGTIKIVLKQSGAQQGTLIVSDDGEGFPEGFNIEESNSLGLRIVRILAEGQLEGSISIMTKKGVQFEIRFPITSERIRA